MAKRIRPRKAGPRSGTGDAGSTRSTPLAPISRRAHAAFWLPFALATAAVLVYWPSLGADLVYDARIEIIKEGFVTSLSNLPAILSLKVLGMNLVLADRPGQLLYLMLIAAVSGRAPFGYHLGSVLLHAANAALLALVLRRLVAHEERASLVGGAKISWAIAAVVLIFALHPLAAEAVANISYSSDLLMTLFTLLALLAAMAFDPGQPRAALLAGGAGTLCAFAAVASKESGLGACALLGVYWFLFRRGEPLRPWLLFLGASATVTAAFLAARFALAPPPSNAQFLTYLGGSFGSVFWVQPRLWVFMMGQIVWPLSLSADYGVENVAELSSPVAIVILVVVVLLQAWLATKSRLGAMGVAIYWLGLVTVSNFLPLNRFLADRFYYLPMAGVAAQLLALLLMATRSRNGFRIAVAFCFLVLPGLTFLTVQREAVFSDELSLWSDTVRETPQSSTAHYNLGNAYAAQGQLDDAISEYHRTLELNPGYLDASDNLASTLAKKGNWDEAFGLLEEILSQHPNDTSARNNLGFILSQKGLQDQAIEQFHHVLQIDPTNADAYYNLGLALVQKGQVDGAIAQFETALKINPNHLEAHSDLGILLAQQGRLDEALVQFQDALRIAPNDSDAQHNLARALALKAQAAAKPSTVGH